MGLKEINTAVNGMYQSTQQNAAMVEETTAASFGLARKADPLSKPMPEIDLRRTQH